MGIRRVRTPAGKPAWEFGCARCDRRFVTTINLPADAVRFAESNGWIIDDPTLCPGCAAAEATNG